MILLIKHTLIRCVFPDKLTNGRELVILFS